MLPIIFLDDGGVINDNEVRGRQWQRLVGEFYAPRLGGTPEDWAEANRVFTAGLFETVAWNARLQQTHNYADFDRQYMRDWITGMCGMLGIEPPPEEEGIALAREGGNWIIPQVRAAYPGAIETIRVLHDEGYTLYTASGASSWDMKAYLEPYGVVECFVRLYGPDLVDTHKKGPEYYRLIFEDSGVRAEDALVLDDNPMVLGWAGEVGARGVLVGKHASEKVSGLVAEIGSLAELPELLQRIEE
jgi:FMN phosphatase YigB (HAD superfamily)